MLILTVSQQLVGLDARTCGVELFDVLGKESLDVALSWGLVDMGGKGSLDVGLSWGLVDMGGKGGRLQPLFTCTSRPQWPVEAKHYFARFVKLLADMKYIFKSETKVQTISPASLSVTVLQAMLTGTRQTDKPTDGQATFTTRKLKCHCNKL